MPQLLRTNYNVTAIGQPSLTGDVITLENDGDMPEWTKIKLPEGTMGNTGYKSPTATGDDYSGWDNPTNAYISNDTDAEAGNNQDQDYYNFDFTIPEGRTITGIRVSIEGSGGFETGTGWDFQIKLSWDGGASTTSAKSDTFNNLYDEGDTIKTLGDAEDTWGRTWSIDELSNTNFRVQVFGDGFEEGLIDHIQAKIYYTV